MPDGSAFGAGVPTQLPQDFVSQMGPAVFQQQVATDQAGQQFQQQMLDDTVQHRAQQAAVGSVVDAAHSGAPAPTQDPTKNPVLSAAMPEIGKPYAGPIVGESEASRWGNVGWDCSSFVAGAYRKVGVNLPAFTDAIAAQTQTIDPKDARPGDIVLYKYNDPYQPGVAYPHTALWLGDGKVLESSYGQGVGVHPVLDKPYEIHRANGIDPSTLGNVAPGDGGASASAAPGGAPMPATPGNSPVGAPVPPMTFTAPPPTQKFDDAGEGLQELANGTFDPVDLMRRG